LCYVLINCAVVILCLDLAGVSAFARRQTTTQGRAQHSTKPFDTPPTVVLDVAGVAEKLDPVVVNIKAFGSGGNSSGSGFIVSSKGLIVTNFHVIAVDEKKDRDKKDSKPALAEQIQVVLPDGR